MLGKEGTVEGGAALALQQPTSIKSEKINLRVFMKFPEIPSKGRQDKSLAISDRRPAITESRDVLRGRRKMRVNFADICYHEFSFSQRHLH